ncbi:hypothetical protein EV361DRAFT_925216 [Lentinula raphanica]|nr:hypothetical protein EV361DRAFT_925216 [Lentinula raphanica]
MDDIKGGMIPPMTSDTLPSFLFDWTKWKANQSLSGNLLGPLFIAAYKCIMTSPSSALEPKIQATRRGNAKIRGIKSVNSQNLAYIATQVLSPIMCAFSDGRISLLSFVSRCVPFNHTTRKMASSTRTSSTNGWSNGSMMRRPSGGRRRSRNSICMCRLFIVITLTAFSRDIFDAEDDEDDDEPSLDSDLVLLQQHMKDYVDSDDEQDIPPTSNSSASNKSLPNTNINGIQDDRSVSAPPPGAMNTSSAEIQDDDDFYEDPAGNGEYLITIWKQF